MTCYILARFLFLLQFLCQPLRLLPLVTLLPSLGTTAAVDNQLLQQLVRLIAEQQHLLEEEVVAGCELVEDSNYRFLTATAFVLKRKAAVAEEEMLRATVAVN
jgi:hypothetical protein